MAHRLHMAERLTRDGPGRACALVVAAATVVACERGPAPAESAVSTRVEAALSSGAVVHLDLGEAARELSADGRFGWELADGTRVLLQSAVRADEEAGSVERTPRAVATALVERVELGDAEGELAHHDCAVGPLPGECVVGWQIDSDGDRWARRGVIFDAAGELVWLDVASASADGEVLNERAASIRASVVVEAGR